MWKIGGGTVWGWISYDPELDLIYYGTSNPGPWNADQRPGDNRWTCSLFARRPDTGEAIWAYQYIPHDDDDYDAVNENVLLDLNIKGQVRKVLAHPDRDGRMYLMDCATGEVLSAEAADDKKTGFKVASYFYLRLGFSTLPAPGIRMPDLLVPTINLLILILSCVPAYWATVWLILELRALDYVADMLWAIWIPLYAVIYIAPYVLHA